MSNLRSGEGLNDLVWNFHFADEQVVIAEDKEDVNYMLQKLDEVFQDQGLTI